VVYDYPFISTNKRSLPLKSNKDDTYKKLIRALAEEYFERFPTSAKLNRKALEVMIDGGHHALRLISPFPPRIASANGAYIHDEDGNQILDFWQGHHANILGHNPAAITGPLAEAFSSGFGLQTGFTDRLNIETASLLCRSTGAERVRFTTSGTLATMYAVLLAKGFTGRDLVVKIGGGWHGAQPWGLKGVDYNQPSHNFQHIDSEGISQALAENIMVIPYNDCSRLEEVFKRNGDSIACFIVEPFIGAGGFIPATPEYLQTARNLTEEYGALLIFDEIISGFRFRAGSAARYYDVIPDLSTLGKICGGGMPVSAVGGRKDVMDLCGKETGIKVRFFGGTYSGHPASMLASKLIMEYLIEREQEVYPKINRLGAMMREAAISAFREEGLYACCTGGPNEVLPGSSLGMLFFPAGEHTEIKTPEDTRDPDVCDLTLSNQIVHLALLLENVHVVHGLGSVSAAHTENDINNLQTACRAAARRIRKGF
jgi:glutamate-1-semialdehyde 2,1-aminomutase